MNKGLFSSHSTFGKGKKKLLVTKIIKNEKNFTTSHINSY